MLFVKNNPKTILQNIFLSFETPIDLVTSVVHVYGLGLTLFVNANGIIQIISTHCKLYKAT